MPVRESISLSVLTISVAASPMEVPYPVIPAVRLACSVTPNRYHGKQAYRHKALVSIEGDLFDISSAGGVFNAAFKAGYHQAGTIERPGQIGEKQHNALYPAHLEQLDTHVAHLGKEVSEESHDLPVDPINDLTKNGIGNKIPNKQWFAHLFSGRGRTNCLG